MTPRDLADVLLKKARQDCAAMRVLAADPDIADDVVGFHAQQAIEKGLKAVLASAGVRYGRTHVLVQLLELLRDAGIEQPDWADEATKLGPYAVTWRYAELDSDEPLDRGAAVTLVNQIIEWSSLRIAAP